MRKAALCFGLIALLLAGNAMAATEEAKQLAIDNGLAWLASTQTTSGAEGYWSYANNGTIAATASAALAFIEEGYLPGDGSMYDGVITKAVTYLFNRAAVDSRFGVETVVYQRYAEDYNNDGVYDEGNDEAIYFEPGLSTRRVYTTGIVVPVVYALGQALGRDTVVGIGSAAIAGKTYAVAMQDIVDWFSWGQVEPNRGNYRGGWRYDANYDSSDNSTAQWGALPLLYAAEWGLGVPQYVVDELELWVDYIQNDANGGSGYDSPTYLVNISKTGGLLLELAAIGAGPADPRVLAAVNYINGQWNTSVSGWDGNFNHPYAMWAVYKGLQVQGYWPLFDCGSAEIRIGQGIPASPGGFTICFEAAPATSVAGDWYSHYCNYLVGIQNANGSWNGASEWTGALATGWYINILNATPVPPQNHKPDCENAYPSIAEIWPPNHKMVEISILGVTDEDGDQVTITVTGITQDEPVDARGDGHTAPDGAGVGTATALVRAERTGRGDHAPGNGRVYRISFVASDGSPEGECTGSVDVCVPHDQSIGPKELASSDSRELLHRGRQARCVDDGQDYDSTVGAPKGHSEPTPGAPKLGAGEFAVRAFPNPFNPSTTLEYALPEASRVSVAIYNALGQRISVLVNGERARGTHQLLWNGLDDSGRAVPSGLYLYQVKIGEQVETGRLILMK